MAIMEACNRKSKTRLKRKKRRIFYLKEMIFWGDSAEPDDPMCGSVRSAFQQQAQSKQN